MDAAETAKPIRNLASLDSESRNESAALLWGAAKRLWHPLFEQWQQDSEFRELLHFSRSAPPKSGSPKIVVGLAVQPGTFEAIRAANNSPRLAEVPPDQDAREFEVHIGGMDFDILTTRDPNGTGAIARFLEKLGEGIQQVEFYVRDVDRATEILRTKFSLPPIYPATRAGADGTRVNFFLAASQGKKTLIELVEASEKSSR
jgi:hypothetical protein